MGEVKGLHYGQFIEEQVVLISPHMYWWVCGMWPRGTEEFPNIDQQPCNTNPWSQEGQVKI